MILISRVHFPVVDDRQFLVIILHCTILLMKILDLFDSAAALEKTVIQFSQHFARSVGATRGERMN